MKLWTLVHIDQSVQRCMGIGSRGRNLGLRGKRWQGNGENCIMRSFKLCTYHQILFKWSKQEEWDGELVTSWEVHIGFWWGDLWERCHLEDLDIDGSIILKWVFKKWDGEAQTGSLWLGIGTGVRHLWIRKWTFGFHKIHGISWLANDLLASQEGLCSVELV